ncbi:MAG: EAL domain-containing protein [Alphaproteobacteria bacterium]|jgi:diguanylate cyclase (GGDEF)-like protein/PAS domain S-box-containing protein|nr:EAL domain-containing protein [Alphaproteobacteria bacterium]
MLRSEFSSQARAARVSRARLSVRTVMMVATVVLIALVTAAIGGMVYRSINDRAQRLSHMADAEAGLAMERGLQTRVDAALEGGATLARHFDAADGADAGDFDAEAAAGLETALRTMLALSPQVRRLTFRHAGEGTGAGAGCLVLTRQRSGDPYGPYGGASLASASLGRACPAEETGSAAGQNGFAIALVPFDRVPEGHASLLEIAVPVIGADNRTYGSLTVTTAVPPVPGLTAPPDPAASRPILFLRGPAPAVGVDGDPLREPPIAAESLPVRRLAAAAMAASQVRGAGAARGAAIRFAYEGVAHAAHLVPLQGLSRSWILGIVRPQAPAGTPVGDLLLPVSGLAATLAALAAMLVMRFADRLCVPMDVLACRLKAMVRGAGEPEPAVPTRFVELDGLQKAVRDLDREIAYREKRHSLVARGRHDGLFDYDFASARCFTSCRLAEILGRSEEVLLEDGRAWLKFLHREDHPTVSRDYERFLAGHAPPFDTEARIVRPDGTARWAHIRAWAVRNETGTAERVVGLMEDVTERKETEARLLHNAFHDSLTGLANRVLFMEQLDWALNQVKANGALASAVLYLDLDRFKAVNDTLGQAAGDDMLITIARRLEEAVGERSFVARLGSDQFAALDTEVHDRDRALTFARRVRTALMAPIMLSGQEVFPTASIGIALCTAGYNRPESVLADASLAMTRAKARGTGQTLMFERGMRGAVLGDALTMETDLRHALERNEISLVYQPIVCLRSGRTAGFEALMRWTHPERGPISPGLFIPLAEDTGLIQGLGAWAIDEACRQWVKWLGDRGAGSSEMPYISVNVSLRQLEDGLLSDRVEEALSSHQVPAAALHLEVTESLMMDGQDRFARLLSRLKGTGVHLSLDDFGIGYSSLSRLHRLPFDTLKIDRSFVSDILTNGNSELVVGAIVDLAHSLGMAVIAEGAETDGDVEALSRAGCDFCQGFVFSRPLPQHEAGRCLDRLWQQPSAPAPHGQAHSAASLKLVEPAE